MKILFLNKRDSRGGVGNYYRVIRSYINDAFYMDINYSMSSYGYIDFIKKYIYFIKEFRVLLKNDKVKVVVFNPSLGRVALFRDYIYHILTTRSNKKQIIFFRGWSDSFSDTISSKKMYRFLFNHIYVKRADGFIVLSNRFKDRLTEWGVTQPIYIESTIVEETMLNKFKIEDKSFDNIELLFLSRIEKDKGIFEALEAVNILLNQGRETHLIVAGDGSAMNDLKKHINKLTVNKITLKGYVRGEEKESCFSSANLFIFPSNHGEGMPNSVLEAMAFGLPILTTKVGGIPDFFEENKMGLFLENSDPQHIAEKINFLMDRPELMRQISEYNFNYAKEHFYASKVADRLQKIIDEVLGSRV